MDDQQMNGGGGSYWGPLAGATRPLAIAGGLLMLATAAMVTVSVLLRWLASSSVAGDIELVQIATAVSVFSFLPICQARRGNIMVDTFTSRLPRSVVNSLDALWDMVYAVFAAIIAWRLLIGAYEAVTNYSVSMMLALPIGWVIGLCAVMAAFLAVVAVATALGLLRSEA